MRGSCNLDMTSNVEIGIEFWNVYLLFCFAALKRRTNCSAVFVMKSSNLIRSWRYPKNITKTQNDDNSTPISKWHDPLNERRWIYLLGV